jgi:hypothetical protein
MPGGPWLAVALLLAPPSAPPRGRPAIAEAERLAAEAVQLAPQDARAAVERARRAVALTVEFDPTSFVSAGRKGEVVEDAFQAARDDYKRHRAIVYQALGGALARAGEPLAASRYLGRAFRLEATPERGLALARVQNELLRGREAFDTVQRAIGGLVGLKPEAVEVITRAADVAGLPSAQAEIDRGRLLATLPKALTLREGPLELPPGVKLSNAPLFRLEDAPLSVIYAAEATCRSCSTDIEALGRQVPKDARVLMLPPGDDQDAALRQVLGLYRRAWPVLMGHQLAAQLKLAPRTVLLIARGGWTLVLLKAPFGNELGAALAALGRSDVAETVPRPAWNRRPVDRSPLTPPPALLPEGLAPGEDEPFPPEFRAAVEAYRAGRRADALKALDALEAKGDGWLLPPDARLDRALCLAGLGQKDAARRLLLRTGDSRFEGAIDALLESVAQAR